MNCSLKCDIDEFSPYGCVDIEVIQVIRWTSAVNLSHDRIDLFHVRYCCWRPENYVAISCFQLWNCLNFLNFWMQQVSLSLVSRDCFLIQTQKIPMIPNTNLSRQVSPLLQPSTRQGMHLPAFLENSTLRRVLTFFLPSRQVSLQMLWVSPAFSTQSDGSRMRNLSRQLMSGSSPSALILPQSCLLLFVLAITSVLFLTFAKFHAGIVSSFPVFFHCCLCIGNLHGLGHRNKFM